MTEPATRSWLDLDGQPIARVTPGDGPIVAFALHAGHTLRPGLEELFAVSEADRLREEDPFTAAMAPERLTLVEVVRSRYEADLNRPRERAVYRRPDDGWGVRLHREDLTEDAVSRSLGMYDTFYTEAARLLSEVQRTFGRFVVFDLHSYNHRRDGAPAPFESNPEVNLGTGRIDRERWAFVIDEFTQAMSDQDFDCRENVKFQGGHFSHWLSERFPDNGVALAIEFKKTYMDEWTGEVDSEHVARIRSALSTASARINSVISNMA